MPFLFCFSSVLLLNYQTFLVNKNLASHLNICSIMPQKLDLFPILEGHDWWHSNNYPSQILSQRFATVLCDEDLSNSNINDYKGFKICPRMPASMKASGISEVCIDENGFQICLDLQDFELEDLEVSTLGRLVQIHGKHEDKEDQYGLVSREFFRQYMVPHNCDINAITLSFSANHILKIKMSKSAQEHRIPDPVLVPVTEVQVKWETKFEVAKYLEAVKLLSREVINKLLIGNLSDEEPEIEGKVKPVDEYSANAETKASVSVETKNFLNDFCSDVSEINDTDISGIEIYFSNYHKPKIEAPKSMQEHVVTDPEVGPVTERSAKWETKFEVSKYLKAMKKLVQKGHDKNLLEDESKEQESNMQGKLVNESAGDVGKLTSCANKIR